MKKPYNEEEAYKDILYQFRTGDKSEKLFHRLIVKECVERDIRPEQVERLLAYFYAKGVGEAESSFILWQGLLQVLSEEYREETKENARLFLPLKRLFIQKMEEDNRA